MALIWVSSPGEMGGPGLVAKLQSQQAEHVHGSVLVTVRPMRAAGPEQHLLEQTRT